MNFFILVGDLLTEQVEVLANVLSAFWAWGWFLSVAIFVSKKDKLSRTDRNDETGLGMEGIVGRRLSDADPLHESTKYLLLIQNTYSM